MFDQSAIKHKFMSDALWSGLYLKIYVCY